MTKFMIILRSQLCCLMTKIRNKNVYWLAKNNTITCFSKQNILYMYFLFWLKNYNWNAVKRHRQWNQLLHIRKMSSQKLLIHYGHKLWKKYIPPVNDFLFIFKTKLLLIKSCPWKLFFCFKQYIRRIMLILLNKEKEHLIHSKWLIYL